MNLIPRHRVSWRRIGDGSRSHAVLVIARGRLHWQSLCGRETAGSQYAPGRPECGKCAEQLQPLPDRIPA